MTLEGSWCSRLTATAIILAPVCRLSSAAQFGAQEPGSNSDIKSFAKKNYGVTFPLMSKVDVNGQGGKLMTCDCWVCRVTVASPACFKARCGQWAACSSSQTACCSSDTCIDSITGCSPVMLCADTEC